MKARRKVPNDGRPSPGRRTRVAAGRDPLKDGARTTVATGPAHHVVHLLQSEHRTVAALFERATRGTTATPAALADIRRELERHAQVEEEIFYPAVAALGDEGRQAIRQARAQHASIRKALGTADGSAPASAVAELRAAVEAHVEFEESVVFAAALRDLEKDDLVALAERMEQRNRALGGVLPLARARTGDQV